MTQKLWVIYSQPVGGTDSTEGGRTCGGGTAASPQSPAPTIKRIVFNITGTIGV